MILQNLLDRHVGTIDGPPLQKFFDGGAAEAPGLGFLWNLDWDRPLHVISSVEYFQIFLETEKGA
jgi:hypothetical protein